MKKKIFSVLLIIFLIFSYGVYNIFFNMGHIPKGEFISEMQSPSREYTIKVYLIESSLSASAVRGELNYNKIKKEPRNIYWDYKQYSANVEWIDNENITINGHKLNVLHDSYDWRKEEFFKKLFKST